MPRLDLFLVSGLILFLELACIRWLPAHVVFLSFFTNTVLLASFVGMSVGCLSARKPGRELDRTPYWLLGLVAAGLLVYGFRGKFERHTDVGNPARPEVVFFGTETSAVKAVEFTIPVEVVAGAFFFLTAVTFVGPGQELGRAFTRVPDRTTAYALDLLGSLSGIGLFAAGSYFQVPPVGWFAVAAGGLAYFLLRPSPDAPPGGRRAFAPPVQALAAATALTVVTSGFFPTGSEGAITRWSPYYRVDYTPGSADIATNLIGHQHMSTRADPTTLLYDFPYLVRGAAGLPAPKRVLVIGSGSGNDISRAARWCPKDARIDAVEIDPVIRAIGRADHPDKPYDDPRITSYLNDGRNFLRRAPDAEYDLVIFALVDSLVLHSGYSNLRLESYLFTREAFADVARVLKPDGTAAMYNFYRQGWIVARIRDQLRAAFGADPFVFTFPEPSGGKVVLDTPADALGGFTLNFVARPDAAARLRDGFAAGGLLWVTPPVGDAPAGGVAFRPTIPDVPGMWMPLRPSAVEESTQLPPATDDWPFLYVRRPDLPGLTVRGVLLTAVLSVLVWRLFRPKAAGPRSGPAVSQSDVRAFLLGAGFMLIETKAVVQMALLFGSTWTVNTAVFAAVLVMALIGNLYAGWVRPTNLTIYYVGLMLALGANMAVPPSSFLGMDPTAQVLASCSLAFAPILFAGVIFPVSFKRAARPDQFFGANVAGAMAGGLMENLSLLTGFQLLLVVAVGLYGLSSLFGRPGTKAAEPAAGYN